MDYVNNITQEYLKSILSYDPETGLFTWLVQKGARALVGSIAGTIRNNGYLKINIDKQLYYAHRLAHLYMTGEWPKNHIDHINGIKNDNHWCNLREATYSQNNKNRASYGSTDKNIYPYRGRFVIRVCLGTYDTKEEAIAVRDKFLKEINFETEFLHSSLKDKL